MLLNFHPQLIIVMQICHKYIAGMHRRAMSCSLVVQLSHSRAIYYYIHNKLTLIYLYTVEQTFVLCVDICAVLFQLLIQGKNIFIGKHHRCTEKPPEKLLVMVNQTFFGRMHYRVHQLSAAQWTAQHNSTQPVHLLADQVQISAKTNFKSVARPSGKHGVIHLNSPQNDLLHSPVRVRQLQRLGIQMNEIFKLHTAHITVYNIF